MKGNKSTRWRNLVKARAAFDEAWAKVALDPHDEALIVEERSAFAEWAAASARFHGRG